MAELRYSRILHNLQKLGDLGFALTVRNTGANARRASTPKLGPMPQLESLSMTSDFAGGAEQAALEGTLTPQTGDAGATFPSLGNAVVATDDTTLADGSFRARPFSTHPIELRTEQGFSPNGAALSWITKTAAGKTNAALVAVNPYGGQSPPLPNLRPAPSGGPPLPTGRGPIGRAVWREGDPWAGGFWKPASLGGDKMCPRIGSINFQPVFAQSGGPGGPWVFTGT